MKYDVFISYSRKDTAIADQICAAFEKVGITYFIDRQGIVGSGEFPEILADAILESRFFLFLASQNSYSSKYTKKEIHFAFNKKPSGTLFPYIIDESVLPNSIELVFSDINIRSIKVHPIETVLVDDMLRLLGRTRPKDNINFTNQKATVPSAPETVKEIKLTPEEKNGKKGFIDEQGKVIISFEYENAHCFSEGLSSVQKNGKWGFINKQGIIAIPFEYENARFFFEGLSPVQKNGKWGFINKQGRVVVPFEYDDECSFSEGLAMVGKKKTTSILTNYTCDCGFINKEGNVVIPFEYDFDSMFGGFKDGLCCLVKEQWFKKLEHGYVTRDKFGFIDKTGKTIIPFIYDNVDCDWDGISGVPEYSPFHEGLVSVFKGERIWGTNSNHEKTRGKWGYLDRQGNVVIPFRYSYAGHFRNGKAQVKTKNIFGKEQTFYIDKQGNRID